MLAKAYLIGIHSEREVASLINAATGVAPVVVASDAGDGGGLVVGGDHGVTWIDVKPDSSSDAHLYPGARTMVSMAAVRGAGRFLSRLVSMTGGLVTHDTSVADWQVVLPPMDADLDPMAEAFTRVAAWMDARETGEILNRILVGDCGPEAVDRFFEFDEQADERNAATQAYEAYRNSASPAPAF